MKLTSNHQNWNPDQNKFVPGRVTTCYAGGRTNLETIWSKGRVDMMFAMEYVMLDMIKMTRDENHGIESYSLEIACHTELEYQFAVSELLHLTHKQYREADCTVCIVESETGREVLSAGDYIQCSANADGYEVEIRVMYQPETPAEKVKNEVVQATKERAAMAYA